MSFDVYMDVVIDFSVHEYKGFLTNLNISSLIFIISQFVILLGAENSFFLQAQLYVFIVLVIAANIIIKNYMSLGFGCLFVR